MFVSMVKAMADAWPDEIVNFSLEVNNFTIRVISEKMSTNGTKAFGTASKIPTTINWILRGHQLGNIPRTFSR